MSEADSWCADLKDFPKARLFSRLSNWHYVGRSARLISIKNALRRGIQKCSCKFCFPPAKSRWQATYETWSQMFVPQDDSYALLENKLAFHRLHVYPSASCDWKIRLWNVRMSREEENLIGVREEIDFVQLDFYCKTVIICSALFQSIANWVITHLNFSQGSHASNEAPMQCWPYLRQVTSLGVCNKCPCTRAKKSAVDHVEDKDRFKFALLQCLANDQGVTNQPKNYLGLLVPLAVPFASDCFSLDLSSSFSSFSSDFEAPFLGFLPAFFSLNILCSCMSRSASGYSFKCPIMAQVKIRCIFVSMQENFNDDWRDSFQWLPQILPLRTKKWRVKV